VRTIVLASLFVSAASAQPAGTSTGGTALKTPGRVGDSPIIGAGNVVASDICARVRYLHVTPQQAANDLVMKELVAQNGDGSVIALNRQGNIATPFNTTGMLTGAVHQDSKIKMSGWSKSAQTSVVLAQ
jgi:beta-aspartyl-peptidase (threonine type)